MAATFRASRCMSTYCVAGTSELLGLRTECGLDDFAQAMRTLERQL